MKNHCRLRQLASLVEKRNHIEAEIALITGRPAERGHIGEFVASEIYSTSNCTTRRLTGEATESFEVDILRGSP